MDRNPRIKKGLGVTVVLLFLSTTCIPVLASEGKPDLIIEDIITKPDNPLEDKFFCRVKNVGNATIMEIIDVDVIVKRLFLGIFPIRTVRSYHVGGNNGDGLSPGETRDFLFAYGSYLPIRGIYRYNCVVNPDHSIDESNYNNNFFSKTYNAFFGYP